MDTSVWSLAFRRDHEAETPEVAELRRTLATGDDIAATGVILLELLRGFIPAAAHTAIAHHFEFVTLLEPARSEYVAAAGLANTCRRAGVQIGTIDALIAQLAIEHGCQLLTTDRDFSHAALHVPLDIWKPRSP